MNKLKAGCKRINELFEDLAADQTIVTDGIIDIEHYTKAVPKILWILKEANSKESWSYQDAFKSSDWLTKNNGLASIRRVLYTSYGLLYGTTKSWCDYPHSTEPTCQEALLNIAYINIKKSPGGNTSNPKELAEMYRLHRELLKLQIETYDADVIIFGNTLGYIDKAYFQGLSEAELHKSQFSNHYYFAGNKLYIDAWHPSCHGKGFTDAAYVMDIVDIYKKWKSCY